MKDETEEVDPWPRVFNLWNPYRHGCPKECSVASHTVQLGT
jgi:hypothetical protein